MWKNIRHFIKHYYLFVIAALGALAALSLDILGYDAIARWILIVVIGGETLALILGMIQDLREGTYGVDILAATAIITALIMQEYWAAMVIVLMLTGGESLEDFAEHRARRELDALLKRAPQKAHIMRGKQEIEVRASEVKPGDTIIVRPGEVVPVDAHILAGTSSLDESSLTGESLPQPKKPGQDIMSGSVNADGVLTAEALHSAADSQYEQIIKLVRAASHSKAPFVRMADRYAIPFTIISFGIAGTAWILSGDSLRFLQVLVVATPCPLILAAPIAIISGMSRAAKQGIIIKNGSALEQLAAAETFAFDKTGTLTNGTPVVDGVKAYHGFKQSEILETAAALEQHSNHALARAVIEKAAKAGHRLPKVKNIKEKAGFGLEARLGGKTVLVGRLSVLEDADVELPATFNARKIQQTAAFVAIGGKLAGVITFKDEIRTEAKTTLQRLRAMGVRDILMVTGDNKSIAGAVAKKLGIKRFFAEALPGDKIHAIETAEQRPVAFVGDGVNDAPVLTASNVGIALGARGSTAASESADVVVMLDSLEHVANSREIARRTLTIAKQSILVGIGLSVVLMLIFATGKFKPIYGAAIQEVVDVVVIINALRAHRGAKKK
ncbi:MAG TPA: heavy metal translocating P-type ATPase [Candidatus Saccharimonadales bacterium]